MAKAWSETWQAEGSVIGVALTLGSAGLEAKQAARAEATVEDLERELAERRAEAEAARAAADRQAREAADQRRAAARAVGAQVAELERGLPAVLEEAGNLATDAGVPEHRTRVLARALLRGTLKGGDVTGGPHSLVLERDAAANLLFGADQRTAHMLAEATATLGLDHPHVARLDAVECQLWRAFLARLRELAGEL